MNLVPDAVGSVDITIRDTRLKFEGAAYHDKVRVFNQIRTLTVQDLTDVELVRS